MHETCVCFARRNSYFQIYLPTSSLPPLVPPFVQRSTPCFVVPPRAPLPHHLPNRLPMRCSKQRPHPPILLSPLHSCKQSHLKRTPRVHSPSQRQCHRYPPLVAPPSPRPSICARTRQHSMGSYSRIAWRSFSSRQQRVPLAR